MGKQPDIIIIGTMKGGTTILHDYICTHPSITPGEKKEIHYFSLFMHRGKKWYENHFSKVPSDQLTIDASPTYFDIAHNDVIPSQIKKYNTNARIILIVRDPVARAVSHYYHLKKVVEADSLKNISLNDYFSKDFSQAITKTTDIDFLLSLTLDFSSYFRKYQAYKKIFSKDKVLVLTNDELRESPTETMARVFSFLKIPNVSDPSFGSFRYSTGSSIDKLSKENYEKLSKLLYPNYKKFCHSANIPYKEQTQNKKNISIVPVKYKDSVHKGLDGWLFLTGGSNNVLNYYTQPNQFDDVLVNKWWNLLKKRKDRLEVKNIQYIHLIAPEKLSLFPEHYNGQLPHFSGHPISSLFSHSEAKKGSEFVINPITFFSKHKDSELLYWKTDTHWTFWGALCAYQLCCSSLGFSPLKTLAKRAFTQGVITFDLGGKLQPPIKEHGTFYKTLKRSKRIHANCLVKYQEENKVFNEEGLHAGTQVIFSNKHSDAHDATIVIFGDSFSEYRPHLLTGMFAETFREVHFIWSSNIDYSYVKKVGANIVITEIAERFMGRVPSDEYNVNEFAKLRLQEYTETHPYRQ